MLFRPGSALDEEAQGRGTSVYLVQRVIPMLPRLLCEQLCSLNPGQPHSASHARTEPCQLCNAMCLDVGTCSCQSE